MGNGIVNRAKAKEPEDLLDPQKCSLISSRLLNVANFIAKSPEARKEFVKFLLAKQWLDDYLQGYAEVYSSNVKYLLSNGNEFDESSERSCSSSSTKTKCAPSSIAVNDASKTRTNNTLINSVMDRVPSKFPVLIIVGVLSIFSLSPEFRDWLETSMQSAVEANLLLYHEELYCLHCQLPSTSMKKNLMAIASKITPSVSFNVSHDKIVEEQEEDLESFYQSCKSSESMAATKTYDEQNYLIADDASTEPPSFNSRQGDRRLSKGNGSLEDAVLRSISCFREETIDALLASTQWLKEFIAYIEGLPFSIAVSSTTDLDVDGRGYPLVYVNRGFETMTQYKRSEVLGRNCSFMQSEQTEQKQVRLMSQALCERRTVRLAVSNVRKNGSSFCNFVAMSPVVDRYGQYTHVIAVQHELKGREGSAKEDFVAINDLLRLLPSVLY